MVSTAGVDGEKRRAEEIAETCPTAEALCRDVSGAAGGDNEAACGAENNLPSSTAMAAQYRRGGRAGVYQAVGMNNIMPTPRPPAARRGNNGHQEIEEISASKHAQDRAVEIIDNGES